MAGSFGFCRELLSTLPEQRCKKWPEEIRQRKSIRGSKRTEPRTRHVDALVKLAKLMRAFQGGSDAFGNGQVL
jgi:hypothetical protein